MVVVLVAAEEEAECIRAGRFERATASRAGGRRRGRWDAAG